MTEKTTSRRSGAWALVGLLLVLSGPAAYFLLIDQPFMRSTGAPGFALIGAGVLVGVVVARRDRRTWVRILGGVNLVALVLAVVSFFSLASLPAAPTFSELETAPDFTLTDHQGHLVSLGEVREGGPVLLIFFRGFW